MKLLFEFFPILLFFIAYKVYGIYVATAVAIAAAALQIGWMKYRGQVVEKMQWITLAILIVFGGSTILFQDETFIKWKPTVINWLFAAAFLGSQWIGQKNLTEMAMGKAMVLPDRIWLQLNLSWVLFFALSGLLNLYVAYNFDTDTWVNFKLFGLMGLTLIFVVLQVLFVSRYIKQKV